MSDDVWELHKQLREHRQRIFLDVIDERDRQVAKWGDQRWPDGTLRIPWHSEADEWRRTNDQLAKLGKLDWMHILFEEIYEASEEEDTAKLRAELVQCAAVIFAWLEDIDRR